MTKHHNITEDAFKFMKYRCGYCGKRMKSNKNTNFSLQSFSLKKAVQFSTK